MLFMGKLVYMEFDNLTTTAIVAKFQIKELKEESCVTISVRNNDGPDQDSNPSPHNLQPGSLPNQLSNTSDLAGLTVTVA